MTAALPCQVALGAQLSLSNNPDISPRQFLFTQHSPSKHLHTSALQLSTSLLPLSWHTSGVHSANFHHVEHAHTVLSGVWDTCSFSRSLYTSSSTAHSLRYLSPRQSMAQSCFWTLSFSSRDGLVRDVKVGGTLGFSDHEMVEFRISCGRSKAKK